MHLNADISSALQLLEDIKQTVEELNDPKLHSSTNQDLALLISVLENPIFRSVVNVQDALSELNQQLGQHPSILPVDFDITASGELAINVVPPGGELHVSGYGDEFRHNPDFDEQRVPSAPVSPSSPQIPAFSTAEDKVVLVGGKPGFSPHQEALRILQKTQTLTTAGAIKPTEEEIVHRSPSAVSDVSKAGSADSLMGTEWAQVEGIELVNDGTGLGFGIVGVRTVGVVVKTILPGGVADRDGRLQSGDHILQIGDVNLHEMGSEQVATVLRQSGTHVRLVVARPADLSSSSDNNNKYLSASAPLVPTRLLTDSVELDRYLIQHKYRPIFRTNFDILENRLHPPAIPRGLTVATSSSPPPLPPPPPHHKPPEMEKFVVELKKDHNGLGITIAGYVCEKEELSGIFVKSVSKASAADASGKIRVNDRIVEVDGQSLQGYTNLQAVEVLRSSGSTVRLCLERYLHGPKYEQLQQAIAASESKPAIPCIGPPAEHPPPPPRFASQQEEGESGEEATVQTQAKGDLRYTLHKNSFDPVELSQQDALRAKWSEVMGPDVEIVVAELNKFGERGGLGISLEGTVDVEDGQEVRPHHYIRSILPEGPVGKNGKLESGDELLEVNGNRLLGMNHHEVVTILKELPLQVSMVCGRRRRHRSARNSLPYKQSPTPPPRPPFAAQRGGKALGGSLQNLLPASDRLVKAKSDGSLTTSVAGITVNDSFTKMKSRSLEPLTGLAMWSSEPQIIELVKGERGLGFSILDYQDPIDPNDTVIVIRSLVPGGVAQMDGRLIPGDRLLFVNDTVLENASLDKAVQALKGASKGIVRIGVAKPLPIPDTVVQLGGTGGDPRSPTTARLEK